MSSRRSIMSRRARRKAKKDFELLLTPLLDIFVIILVFLLKTYDTSLVTIAPLPGMKLPVSVAEDAIDDGVNLFVSLDALVLDRTLVMELIPGFVSEEGDLTGEPIGDGDLGEEGRLILPLFDELKLRRQALETVKGTTEQVEGEKDFVGMVNIVSDKRIPYELLRKVMYTATSAGYHTFKLGVERKPSI